jgi:hypothetical protein
MQTKSNHSRQPMPGGRLGFAGRRRPGMPAFRAVMTPNRLFYLRAVGLLWIVCVLFSFAVPGPERVVQSVLLGFTGFWLRPVIIPALASGHISIVQAMIYFAFASTVTIAGVAFALDWIRTPRFVWVRSILIAAILPIGVIVRKLIYESRGGETWQSAAVRMELGEQIFAWLLFCVGSAVVVGSFVTLGQGAIRRLFNPANQALQPTRPRPDVSHDP